MTDLPTDLPAGSDGEPEEAGGVGGEPLAETRAYITRRMQQLASKALNVYEAALSPGEKPPRNLGAQLGAARDIVQMLTEGKISQPVPEKPAKLASVTSLAALSEEIRLAKQAERRNGR